MVFVLFKPKLTGDCYEMYSDHHIAINGLGNGKGTTCVRFAFYIHMALPQSAVVQSYAQTNNHQNHYYILTHLAQCLKVYRHDIMYFSNL